MQFIRFSKDDDGKQALKEPIPENMVEDAQGWREVMLEALYGISNELAELALEEKPIPPELIRKALREGCISMQIQPVSVRLSLAWHGNSTAARWRWLLLAEPARSSAGRWHRSQEALISNSNANHQPKIRSAHLCSKFSLRKQATFTGSASTQERSTPTHVSTIRTAIKKKTSPNLWQIHATKKGTPRPSPTTGMRRHRVRHRPTFIDHWRHSVRHARDDRTAKYSVRASCDFDGDRA